MCDGTILTSSAKRRRDARLAPQRLPSVQPPPIPIFSSHEAGWFFINEATSQ